MTLIGDILGYKSLSIVGLEKNTGKTECLNYVLRNLPEGLAAAVTSIGTDGERKDVVTGTRKPEIYLRCGTIFATTEKYYLRRRLVAEVLDVGDEGTSVGRIITARALSGGKVMLSGPPSTAGIAAFITACHLSLCRARSIQSMSPPPKPIYLRSSLILSFHNVVKSGFI